jgi:hypothetical protein
LLDEARNIFENSKDLILSLSDFEKAFGSDEFMKKSKQLGPVFRGKTKKSATIGISGIKKILLSAYNTFTKGKIITFATKNEALEYLVKE